MIRLMSIRHGLKALYNQSLLDFKSMSTGEVLVGPYRIACYLLVGCQLTVDSEHQVWGLIRLFQDQHGVYFISGSILRQADDCSLYHTRLPFQQVLDIIGVHVLSVGEDDKVLLPTFKIEEPLLIQGPQVTGLVP